MKFLAAVIITVLLTIIPRSEGNINNTVANNRSDKEIRTAVTNSSKKKKAKKPKTVHKGTVTPITTSQEPNCNAYDKLLARHFGDDIGIAKAVMQAESGCRADAVGDGHLTYIQDGVTYGMSCGLFQIRYLPGRPNCSEMHDASKNIRYAATMFKASGWQPWSAFLNGTYLRYLK